MHKINDPFDIEELSSKEREIYNRLDQNNFFCNYKSDNLELTDFEVERHSRTLDYFERMFIEENNINDKYELLVSLKNKRILLVGVGGLGSWVLYHLLCIGIENITLLDGDIVEISNLNRSIMYRENDVGSLKVEAAMQNAQKFYSNSHIKALNINLTDEVPILNELQNHNYDLVISCADKPYWKIQNWIQKACEITNTPLLIGVGGKIGPLYIPKETACRNCFLLSKNINYADFEEQVNKLSMLPDSRQGVFIPIVSLNASILSYEAITFLIDKNRCNSINHVLIQKSLYEFERVAVKKEMKCTCR